MINRIDRIKRDNSSENSKSITTDFGKIRVGLKTLDDAVANLGFYKKANPRFADKETVIRAIDTGNLEEMREISNFFYKTSGIYNRLCRYIAYLYRYDWYVTPYKNSDSVKNEKLLDNFNKILMYLDNFEGKKFFGEKALQVIKEGCYYGYKIPSKEKVVVQDLPSNYCRSRYELDGKPAVEFNMKFFDEQFRDTTQRMKMLNLFPKEFKKGYILYKEGKLLPEFQGDTSGWYLLDPKFTVKFNMGGVDYPNFISIIPTLIDLDEAQDLDRKKMQQQLLKIIIQKMPIDKNGDLVFDVEEAQALHNNAVQMLKKAIGIDVLTTFADTEVADMSDKNNVSSVDALERVERTVFNEAGISQMQFNTNGNIALEKSISNDEASAFNLILQFEKFLNDLISDFNKTPKKFFYRVQMLPTTIYNYKDLSKLYKEQTQLGYSKILPALALGQSQSSILATAYFENEILDLVNVFVPPMSSNTMSSKEQSTDNKGGRPQKNDDQKAEKTIKNIEAGS